MFIYSEIKIQKKKNQESSKIAIFRFFVEKIRFLLDFYLDKNEHFLNMCVRKINNS